MLRERPAREGRRCYVTPLESANESRGAGAAARAVQLAAGGAGPVFLDSPVGVAAGLALSGLDSGLASVFAAAPESPFEPAPDSLPPPSPSPARFRLPSFLKSVSYQPLPAR